MAPPVQLKKNFSGKKRPYCTSCGSDRLLDYSCGARHTLRSALTSMVSTKRFCYSVGQMRWPALLSVFAKIWPVLFAALGCAAALIRLIGSSTPTSTTHILIGVAILCFFISVFLAIVEGQREYRRLTATVLATLNTVPEHGGA